MNVSVVGLGKLGSPLAAVLAHKGCNVVGVDLNRDFVNALNEGRPPVNEPGLAEMIAANRTRLSATQDYEKAVAGSEITFVIVPTPSDAGGAFSMRYALSSAESIGQALRSKNGWHLVVLTSTVMPGATGGQFVPALEKASGKKVVRDFGVCYNPEFIALGSVIRDMLAPDMILIGESDPRAGEALAAHHRSVCDNQPAIARMNFVNAELTKISVNTYVTTKISYANMLAQMCEKLPGADVDVVTAALGNDTRIGKKYLKGALGYGGPCFPRDNVAFGVLARQHGVQPLIAEATDAINRLQAGRLAELALARLPKGGKVGILGLSYKPCTEVIEEAQGVALARLLLSMGTPVVVYDPAALPNARRVLEGDVTFAATMADCTRACDVVVLTTPWDEFSRLSPDDLKYATGRPTVIDCWRVLPAALFEARANYETLGRGPRAEGR